MGGYVTQPGPGYGPASSTTSVLVGTGNQTFTFQGGLAYSANATVIVTSTGSNAWMYGSLTSYNSSTGSTVVNVSQTNGSGTHSDWTLNISGLAAGVPGAWQNATLQNSWNNTANAYPPRYRYDPTSNVVFLGGAISNNAPGASTVALTLGAGYIPANSVAIPVAATIAGNNYTATAAVASGTGAVTIGLPVTFSTTTCWLDSASFPLS